MAVQPLSSPSAGTFTSARKAQSLWDYEWKATVPFLAVHLLPFGALVTGAGLRDFVVCAVLYVVRMFGVTGGYHRYFSHRTFKTSRWFQFVLAWLAQSSSQRGVLWWAAHHRDHHKYSDTPRDPHSPIQFGFWHAHVGWIYDHNSETKTERVRDLAKFPELRFLDRFWWLPPATLGFAVWALFGWSGLFIGFGLSTVLVWHGTFTINSLTHLVGKRRFETGDESRNHWLLALITLGEGWHNNHHYYQGSVRQGFYWWEIDVTYYVIRALAAVGLVWDVREPPARVYAEARRAAGRRALSRIAAEGGRKTREPPRRAA